MLIRSYRLILLLAVVILSACGNPFQGNIDDPVDNTSAVKLELDATWTPEYANLIGYWKMNGDWLDSSGKGNHGVATGTAFISGERLGSHAAEFNGTSDLVTVAHNVGLNLTTDFAFSVWVYLNSYGQTLDTGSYFARILRKRNNYQFFVAQTDGTFIPRLVVKGVNNTATLDDLTYSGAGILPLYGWTHLGASRIGGVTTLFINGVAVATNNTMAVGAVTAFDLIIGNFDDGTTPRYFDGMMDDLAMFNVGLTNAQMQLIYYLQKP